MGKHLTGMNGLEAPEVQQALAKVEEYARLAGSAKSPAAATPATAQSRYYAATSARAVFANNASAGLEL